MKFVYLSLLLIGLNSGCAIDPMQADAEEVARLTFEFTNGMSNPDISKMGEYMLLGKRIEEIDAKYSNSPQKEEFASLVKSEMAKLYQNEFQQKSSPDPNRGILR